MMRLGSFLDGAGAVRSEHVVFLLHITHLHAHNLTCFINSADSFTKRELLSNKFVTEVLVLDTSNTP